MDTDTMRRGASEMEARHDDLQRLADRLKTRLPGDLPPSVRAAAAGGVAVASMRIRGAGGQLPREATDIRRRAALAEVGDGSLDLAADLAAALEAAWKSSTWVRGHWVVRNGTRFWRSGHWRHYGSWNEARLPGGRTLPWKRWVGRPIASHAKAVRALGRLGVAATVISYLPAFVDGIATGDRGKVGEATGGAAGGIAGGLVGAKIGAAIGSFGGPVGVVAGAVIGGAIGGFIGSGLGEKAGKLIGGHAGKAAKSVGKAVDTAKKFFKRLF